MNFREHCQHIVQSVPGATACVLMGFDCIPIDTFEAQPSAYDLPTHCGWPTRALGLRG